MNFLFVSFAHVYPLFLYMLQLSFHQMGKSGLSFPSHVVTLHKQFPDFYYVFIYI